MKHSICSRSISAALVLTVSALFSAEVIAQTTATTIPVGFITKTVPAGAVGSPSSAIVSIPLYATAVFTSAATAVNANAVTLASAAFTTLPNPQFAVPAVAPLQGIANPHLLRVKTGTGTGLFFAITGNTANSVTVALPPSVATLVGVVSVNDSCEIVPANTLGSVFGNATTPPTLTGGANLAAADNVYLFNGASWVAYYYSSASSYWKQSGNADRSNTVIFPDDLAFISRKDTSGPANITLMGTVPSTLEQSELPTGSIAFANRFPVDMTLAGLGLQNLPGWVPGPNAATADNVYLFSGTAWVKYYFSNTVGSSWWKQSGNADRGTTPISAGTGVFIVRSGALGLLSQALPYTP